MFNIGFSSVPGVKLLTDADACIAIGSLFSWAAIYVAAACINVSEMWNTTYVGLFVSIFIKHTLCYFALKNIVIVVDSWQC